MSQQRVPSLDGLRTVAVLLVLTGHLAEGGRLPAFLSGYANFGVQVFFVISGFIITRLLLQEREQTGAVSLRDFYKRRLFRIVPAAYLYVAIAAALHVSLFHPTDFVYVLSFTANYDLHRPIVVAHLWSLGIEEQFYILWPLVLTTFFRHRTKVLLSALCAAPFIVLVLRACHCDSLVGFSFPTSYDSLALGCLGAVLYYKALWLRSRWFLLCLPAALLCQWPFWTIPGLGYGHTLWPLTHLFVSGFVIHATHHRYFLLNTAPVVWIGLISYGIYLWQTLFIFPKYVPMAPLWTLLCACLSYYAVERPSLRLVRPSRNLQPASL